MKPAVIALSVALVGTLAAGGLLYRQHQLTQRRLNDEVAKASLAREDLSRQLGDTTTQLEAVHGSLARVSLELEHTKAQREAIAGMQQRLLQLTSLANTDLASAWEQAGAAQQRLVDDPSRDAFSALKSSLSQSKETVAKCRAASDELEQYLTVRESDLTAAAEDVKSVRDRLTAARAQFEAIATKLENVTASLRELTFTALASEGWAPTDLTLADGEVVAISASGEWRWGNSENGLSGPDGESGSPAVRFAPQLPNGALIARIRGSSFVHKALGGIQPDRAGKLELRINDTTGADNDGSIEVVMWAFKPLE